MSAEIFRSPSWFDEFGPVVCPYRTYTADEIANIMAMQGIDEFFERVGEIDTVALRDASDWFRRGNVDEALVQLERALAPIDGLHFGGLDAIIRRYFTPRFARRPPHA